MVHDLNHDKEQLFEHIKYLLVLYVILVVFGIIVIIIHQQDDMFLEKKSNEFAWKFFVFTQLNVRIVDDKHRDKHNMLLQVV
jgi:hypothetical protein